MTNQPQGFVQPAVPSNHGVTGAAKACVAARPLRAVACGCALLAVFSAACPRGSPRRDAGTREGPGAQTSADASAPSDARVDSDGAPAASVDARVELPREPEDAAVGGSRDAAAAGPDAAAAGPDAAPAGERDDAGSDEGNFTLASFAPELEIAALDVPLTARFSAAVDPSSVSPRSFRVTRDGRDVSGELSVEADQVVFRPRRAWALAASYSVELTDALRDRDGRALAHRSFDLQVREGSWTVEPWAPALHQPRSDVAVAPNGRAVIAWVNGGVQLRQFAPERGWTEIERISDETARVFYPSLAIDGRGRVVASWNYAVNPVGRIYLPGEGWQPHFYFRGVPGGGQEVRRATWSLREEGEAVGVFSVLRLPPVETGTIDAVRLDVTSGAREVYAISPSETGYDMDPQLGWLDDQPLFAWVEDVRAEGAPPRGEIWLRHGFAGAAQRISSATAQARAPALASAVDRRSAWLVWEEIQGGRATLWASKIEAGRSPGTPQRIAEPFDASEREPNPVLAIDAHGAVHVAWEQPDAALWTVDFDPARGWRKPLQLSAASTPATQPAIAFEPGGHGLLLWAAEARGMDRDSSPVHASRYLAGSGWSSPRELATGEAGAAMVSDRISVAIGMDDSGRAWACWTGGQRLNVARFD